MATEEEKLARLFNSAYLIQQYEAELANSIIKSGNKNSGYSQAFQAGEQQQLKDKIAKQ